MGKLDLRIITMITMRRYLILSSRNVCFYLIIVDTASNRYFLTFCETDQQENSFHLYFYTSYTSRSAPPLTRDSFSGLIAVRGLDCFVAATRCCTNIGGRGRFANHKLRNTRTKHNCAFVTLACLLALSCLHCLLAGL